MLKMLRGCLLLFVANFTYAQSNQGARFTGMANASAAVYDKWSVNANPAGITKTQTATTALNFTKHLFGDELSEQNFAFALPFNHNFAGLSLNRYGISEFNEIKAGLVFAKAFGNQLSIGIKANFHQIKITNYGAASTFSVDAGVNYALNQQLVIGLYVNNPSSQVYKSTTLVTSIPTVIHFGAAYQPTNKVILATNIAKDFNRKIDVSVGVDYQFLSLLGIRGGLSAKPFKQFFGLSLNYEKLVVDFAVESHPQIGYTPQMGLSYAF